MRNIPTYTLFAIFFWMLSFTLAAQEPGKQTVRIVSGKSVKLIAEAENAHLGYIWFRNGEAIVDTDADSIRVFEDGLYAVVAKGEFCDSDPSDPVEVIIIEDGPPQTIDLAITNPADRHAALLGQLIQYQIMVSNKSPEVAREPYIEIKIPIQTRYQNPVGLHPGRLEYDASGNILKWYLDSLSGGSQAVLEISVIAEREGVAEQLAIVTSTSPESFPGDNQSKSTVSVIALHIPNVFTPNQDGINDTFEIKGIEFLQQNRVTIFNPDGLEVYKATNYKNNWDGKSLNAGTYYYIVEILMPNGEWELFKGHLTLLR